MFAYRWSHSCIRGKIHFDEGLKEFDCVSRGDIKDGFDPRNSSGAFLVGLEDRTGKLIVNVSETYRVNTGKDTYESKTYQQSFRGTITGLRSMPEKDSAMKDSVSLSEWFSHSTGDHICFEMALHDPDSVADHVEVELVWK